MVAKAMPTPKQNGSKYLETVTQDPAIKDKIDYLQEEWSEDIERGPLF